MFVLYLWLEETVVKMPPDDRTASAPPAAVKSSIFTWPLTSNFAEGPVVPMPTLPELSILIRSLPPVDKLSALAPLDHIPVSKSPLKLMPGAPTAPKLKEPTPLTSNFEFGLVVPMPTLPLALTNNNPSPMAEYTLRTLPFASPQLFPATKVAIVLVRPAISVKVLPNDVDP